MKRNELKELFAQYCNALGLTIDESRFMGGDEYHIARPGTVCLKQSDPRAGTGWAIAKYGENGTISILYGYVSKDRLTGYLEAGIEISASSATPSKAQDEKQETVDYVEFREIVKRYPSLKDKDYKQELFSDVLAEYGYTVKPEPDGSIDCGDGEYSDYKGYLNVLLYEVTE